jgi:hypothetical protein
LKPEELMVLPEDVSLVFHRNLPVIPARLVPYFRHPAFRNGGTGNEPGLGPTTTEKAVWVLLASVVFAAIAAYLSPFDLWPDRPAVFEWPVESGWPDSSSEFKFPPLPDWPSSP